MYILQWYIIYIYISLSLICMYHDCYFRKPPGRSHIFAWLPLKYSTWSPAWKLGPRSWARHGRGIPLFTAADFHRSSSPKKKREKKQVCYNKNQYNTTILLLLYFLTHSCASVWSISWHFWSTSEGCFKAWKQKKHHQNWGWSMDQKPGALVLTPGFWHHNHWCQSLDQFPSPACARMRSEGTCIFDLCHCLMMSLQSCCVMNLDSWYTRLGNQFV